MENSLIYNICNEFSFEHQNDHNVKNQVRAFFSKFVTKSTEIIPGIFFETSHILI